MAATRACRWLVSATLLLAVVAPVEAATVTLAWNANSPGEGVTNYNVFVSTQAGVFGGTGLAVGNRTTWTFVGLQDRVQYYFAVQAQSPSGLSGLSQIGYMTPLTSPPTSEAARSDFNGDGWMDLLWEHSSTNQRSYWLLNGRQVVGMDYLNPSAVASGWKLAGSGDFSKDGKPDLIWHNQQTGQLVYWLMDGSLQYASGFMNGPVSPQWQVASIRDFNGDGNPDIWWHNQVTGDLLVWYFNGTTYIGSGTPSPSRISETNWKLAGAADFTSDGKPDAIWHNVVTGELRMWTMDGIVNVASANLNPAFVATGWKIAAVGDANGDGRPDLLWRHDTSGQLVLWEMQGVNVTRGDYLSIPSADPNWKIMAPK